MKRIILHIGTPKTGSTALQLFLTDNQKLLEQGGIGYYPRLHRYHLYSGWMNADWLLAQVMTTTTSSPPELKPWHRKELDAYFERDMASLLKEELASFRAYLKDHDTIILSDEILWDYAAYYRDFWTIVRNCLLSFCGDTVIDVIVYLRRQDIWALTKYKEDMRNHFPHPLYFHESLADYERLGHLDYDARIRRLEDAFGGEHLIVRPYERSQLIEGDVSRDFISSCGLSWREDYVSRKESNRSNTLKASYGLAVINKEYYASGKGPAPMAFFSASSIYSSYRPEKRKTHALDIQERRALVDKYAAGNNRISQDYLDGQPLFNDVFDGWDVLRPDPVRDRKTARWIRRIVHRLGMIMRLDRFKIKLMSGFHR